MKASKDQTNDSVDSMKALQYGPDRTSMVVTIVPKPVPSDLEMLVSVEYSALDTSVPSLAKKDIMSYFVHNMLSGATLLSGYHYCGKVETIGKKVTDFKPGDVVFGHLQYNPFQKQGAFAEYITVKPSECARKPATITGAIAAASTTEGTTALQSLRDEGGLKSGGSVLVLGAGGSVGSLAVQIAKALGAQHVTAVCSTKDVERVRKLGADEVLDRSKGESPFEKSRTRTYDVVFDTPSLYSYWQATQVLRSGGAFVQTIPTSQRVLYGWFIPLFTGKKYKTVECQSKHDDLELIAKWMSDRTIHVEVDSQYKIVDFNDAWARYKDNTKTGRVVVQVKDGW